MLTFRTDKIDEAKARARAKANVGPPPSSLDPHLMLTSVHLFQIEADKQARIEKAAREKALRTGQPLPGYEHAQAPVVAPVVRASTATEARIQVSLISLLQLATSRTLTHL